MSNELANILKGLPSNWTAVRREIAEMEDIREIMATERRVKALVDFIAAETRSNADAFGMAMCALDLMARAGEVIEDMQAQGGIATEEADLAEISTSENYWGTMHNKILTLQNSLQGQSRRLLLLPRSRA